LISSINRSFEFLIIFYIIMSPACRQELLPYFDKLSMTVTSSHLN
jgi:hypothetical protein